MEKYYLTSALTPESFSTAAKTISGTLNTPYECADDCIIADGTIITSYFPAAVQITVSGKTVTVGNAELSCNSIRNAAILFGEDAYWGDFCSGTVTFTGSRAELKSTSSHCITAAGITGQDLVVTFSGDADNSGNIKFISTQGTGPANEASGIKANGTLTVNGNFGGMVQSYLDCSNMTSTRWGEVFGFLSSGDMLINGDITGSLICSAYTEDTEYNWLKSQAYGLSSDDSITVNGQISGTIVALAETAAYGICGESINATISGTIFAGNSVKGQSVNDFMTKLADTGGNKSFLLDLSDNEGFYSIYANSQSTVDLISGADIWGDIWMQNNSSLTISSDAAIYGNITLYGHSGKCSVEFVLGNPVNAPVINGALYDYGWGYENFVIDASEAVNGQYILAEEFANNSGTTISVEVDGAGENITLNAGGKKSCIFANGMRVEIDNSNSQLLVNVSGSSNVIKDKVAPELKGLPNADVEDDSVSFTWNAATDNIGVAGYMIRWGNSSALSDAGVSVSVNNFQITDLENGDYYYQICAYDKAGNYSDWSSVQTFTVDYTPPVYLPGQIPQAEYMYGCTATVIGMLLGYYDCFGYIGYDMSNLIRGDVELNARGLDGNAYDMDAFDTVLGSAIASEEYVERFSDRTPAEEYDHTFCNSDYELNTSAWNCLADYLGTGQYWRGNGDLATSYYHGTLEDISNYKFTRSISSGNIFAAVPAQYCDMLYGLNLYVNNAGYSLDTQLTKTVYTSNNNGDFGFEDYKAEIDAGRAVLIHIENHTMLGYGYDAVTNEIIFDDTYQHDQRMTWGGSYYYSNEYRQLQAVSTIVFDTEKLQERPTVAAPTVSADTESPTRFTVTLTISFSPEAEVNEYSYDQKEWLSCSGTVVVDHNRTVYFRSQNSNGEYSQITSYTVDNIDKTAPKLDVSANLTAYTAENVTVTVQIDDINADIYYRADHNEEWQTYSDPGVKVENNTVLYFKAIDKAGNVSEIISYTVSNIDREDPQFPVINSVIVNDSDVLINWNSVSDNGPAGVGHYLFRHGSDENLSGSGTITAGTFIELSDLDSGRYFFQIRAVDKAGNSSAWSEMQFFEIEDIRNLQVTDKKISWDAADGADSYIVEYSQDNFAGTLKITTADTELDVFALPQGSYQCSVKTTDSEIASVRCITVDAVATAPQKFISDADGNMDLFFANTQGRWSKDFVAEHQGTLNGWRGTAETVEIAGKNNLSQVFIGSSDANVLLMTDDICGDALFVDDIYTALGGEARLKQINEIRAGAGDDVIDMTGQRYNYIGSGVKIYGGDGDDVIWANNGSNILFGDSGSDNIVGGSGNDTIIGGSGNDFLHGGGGSDTFTFGGDWGSDTVEQLDGGKVILWFENGSQNNWDVSKLTYSDGNNSVVVSGVTADDIELCFGDPASLPDGVFADFASQKIFEDKENGFLA